MTDSTRWNATWIRLGTDPPAGPAFEHLVARYSEPHRAYHNLDHLFECFAAWDEVQALAEHPAEIEIALWYHDVIYDSHRQDNEVRSARMACEVLQGVLENSSRRADTTKRVEQLILATRHAALPTDPDAALLVDIDLSILGATPDRFAEYDRQIRREYSWVPPSDYRAGRAKVLRGFLNRARIYTTTAFAHLEAPARVNLAAALESLEL